MTDLQGGGADVPERDARDARFFAWDVPADARIVALVHEPEDAERSATVIDAITTSVARRREHTLLLSAEPGPTPLDELLGGARSQGLPAALSGRARLTDIAVQRADRPFVYLPAGSDPDGMRAALEDRPLASFVRRVRERGGTLFIVVSDGALRSEAVRRMVDGYVALGDVEIDEVSGELAAFGRIRFEEAEEEGAPPAAGDEEEGPEQEASMRDADGEPRGEGEKAAGSWKRHRASTRFPTKRVALAATAVLAVVAGWWGISRASQTMEPGEDPTELARGEAPAERAAPAALDPEQARNAFAAAPELPYSVLIASYAVRADADEHVARLRSAEDPTSFYFVAPTPVRGVIYHRIFAGALPGRPRAAALMERLVASGEKREASDWDLRPARLAFDLGMFGRRGEAEARVAALTERGVPAYVLGAPLEGDSAYQVYGGAYESERASIPLAELLGEAGEPASLIARRGADPTSSSSSS